MQLTEPGGRIAVEGTLVRLSADSVVVSDGSRALAFALGHGRGLERWVGRHRATGTGAATGGLIGAGVGAILGAAGGTYFQPAQDEDVGSAPAYVAALGGVALGVTGAALGAGLSF